MSGTLKANSGKKKELVQKTNEGAELNQRNTGRRAELRKTLSVKNEDTEGKLSTGDNDEVIGSLLIDQERAELNQRNTGRCGDNEEGFLMPV